MPDEATAIATEPSTTTTPSTETVSAAPSESKPATPAPETPAQAAADLEDDVYNTAFAETMVDAEDSATPAEPKAEAQPKAENPTAQPSPESTPKGPVMTESEERVLKRAGLDPEDYAGWDRKKIEDRVGKLRQTQAEQDRLGAELANLKKAPNTTAEVKEEKPKPAAKEPRAQRIASLMQKLPESYDEEIKPLIEVIQEMDQENQSLRQQAEVFPIMGNLIGEMVLDSSIDALRSEYPSLAKSEVRQKVTDRFWTEWNTGAYAKPGTSMVSAIREALANSVKVTINTTTEQAAVANLVTANKQRVANQPKSGSPNARPGPKTADDVYAEAFEATLGKELRGT